MQSYIDIRKGETLRCHRADWQWRSDGVEIDEVKVVVTRGSRSTRDKDEGYSNGEVLLMTDNNKNTTATRAKQGKRME